MLTHSHNACGKTSAADLMSNDAKIKQSCDPAQLFEDLIDRIELGSDCASAGNQPHSPQQIISIFYSLAH